MGRGNVDLDHSLDEIIRTNTQPTRGRASTFSGRGSGLQQQGRVSTRPNNSNHNRSNSINRRVGNIPSNRNDNSGINARLSRGGVTKPRRGGISSSSATAAVGRNGSFSKVRGPDMSDSRSNNGEYKRKSIDPKSLVITKKISKRKPKEEASIIPDPLPIQPSVSKQQDIPQPDRYGNYQQQRQRVPYTSPRIQLHQQQQPVPQPAGTPRNIVLVCNLDPRATAEDVGEACSTFGPILSCDVLLDPMGRPLNEAEIEFLYPASAEECVSKLDNSMADGRLLRVRLQNSATLPVVPRYSSRTVVASARVTGFDSPAQPLPMMSPQDYHQQHHQSNSYRTPSYPQHYHQQQQRRY